MTVEDLTCEVAQLLHTQRDSTREWSRLPAADRDGYVADARAVLVLAGPRSAAAALQEMEDFFRRMAVAGYNRDIVAGIEGCADVIADRLLSTTATPLPVPPGTVELEAELARVAEDLRQQREDNRRLRALAVGRDDDHCLCGCRFEDPTLEAIRRAEALEREVAELRAQAAGSASA